MDDKNFLLEYVEPKFRIVESEHKDSGVMRVKVVWQKADTINENRRVYPRRVLEKAINQLKPKFQEGKVFGFAFHPDDAGRVDDVSHLWEDAWINEDGTCEGVVKILPTDAGRNIQAIIGNGGYIGMSSRGVGRVIKKELEGIQVEEVDDNYVLESPGDFVLFPSVPGAGIRKVLEARLNKSRELLTQNNEEEKMDNKQQDADLKTGEGVATDQQQTPSNTNPVTEDTVAKLEEKLKQLEEEHKQLQENYEVICSYAKLLEQNNADVVSDLMAARDLLDDAITALKYEGEEGEAKDSDEEETASAAEDTAEKEKSEDTTESTEPAKTEESTIDSDKSQQQQHQEDTKQEDKAVTENTEQSAAPVNKQMEMLKFVWKRLLTEKADLRNRLAEKLITEEGEPTVDSVEALEAKISELKADFEKEKADSIKEKIIKSGIKEKGIVAEDSNKDSMADHKKLNEAYRRARIAGFKGTLEEYVQSVKEMNNGRN